MKGKLFQEGECLEIVEWFCLNHYHTLSYVNILWWFSILGCIKYDRGYECITCVSMWCNVFLVPMFYRDLKVMTSVIISWCRSRGKAMLDIFFSNFEMKMSCDLNKQFSIL